MVSFFSKKVAIFISFQALFLVSWSMLSLVEGFSSITPETFWKSHVGFFLAIEIGVLFAAIVASYSKLYGVFLVVGIASNTAHFIGSIMEWVDCATELCVKNDGFLISFIIVLASLIGVESMILYHTYKHINKKSNS